MPKLFWHIFINEGDVMIKKKIIIICVLICLTIGLIYGINYLDRNKTSDNRYENNIEEIERKKTYITNEIDLSKQAQDVDQSIFEEIKSALIKWNKSYLFFDSEKYSQEKDRKNYASLYLQFANKKQRTAFQEKKDKQYKKHKIIFREVNIDIADIKSIEYEGKSMYMIHYTVRGIGSSDKNAVSNSYDITLLTSQSAENFYVYEISDLQILS